jgi:hypothetical protein
MELIQAQTRARGGATAGPQSRKGQLRRWASLKGRGGSQPVPASAQHGVHWVVWPTQSSRKLGKASCFWASLPPHNPELPSRELPPQLSPPDKGPCRRARLGHGVGEGATHPAGVTQFGGLEAWDGGRGMVGQRGHQRQGGSSGFQQLSTSRRHSAGEAWPSSLTPEGCPVPQGQSWLTTFSTERTRASHNWSHPWTPPLRSRICPTGSL